MSIADAGLSPANSDSRSHWFRVTMSIPSAWSSAERVQLEFDPSCEAMIFDTEGCPLQGITGGNGIDRRVEFILPKEKRSSGYKCEAVRIPSAFARQEELTSPVRDGGRLHRSLVQRHVWQRPLRDQRPARHEPLLHREQHSRPADTLLSVRRSADVQASLDSSRVPIWSFRGWKRGACFGTSGAQMVHTRSRRSPLRILTLLEHPHSVLKDLTRALPERSPLGVKCFEVANGSSGSRLRNRHRPAPSDLVPPYSFQPS